jgi:integrase
MLTQAVESYLAMRRTLGFRLYTEGCYLHAFARFAEARDEQWLCAKTAMEWAALGGSPRARARRLGTLIRFARHIHAEDQRHEIPPEGVFGSETGTRPVHYIFSPEQIRQIVEAASRMETSDALLPHTLSTLFALLACTGMRISEALKLHCEDISVDGLIIRETKFRKSRLLPLHETAEAGLKRYLQLRQSLAPAADEHLFVSPKGTKLHYLFVWKRFRKILESIGLESHPARRHPTLHCLRHTFAARALESCPDGRDLITKHMVSLSTYLGHYSAVATYWYLEATPNLMDNIAEACEKFLNGGSQ